MSTELKKPLIVNDDYHKRANSDSPCVICGKRVDTKTKHLRVHVVDGGDSVLAKDAEYDDEASDLYWLPIGRQCAKKHGLLDRTEVWERM